MKEETKPQKVILFKLEYEELIETIGLYKGLFWGVFLSLLAYLIYNFWRYALK